MARRPTNKGGNQESSTPTDFPSVPPQDLYPTSDIRFVMLEIGKLTAKVDRLVDDVSKHGQKIENLNHQASYLRGWIAAAVVLIGVFIAIGSFFLNSKWSAVIQVLNAASK